MSLFARDQDIGIQDQVDEPKRERKKIKLSDGLHHLVPLMSVLAIYYILTLYHKEMSILLLSFCAFTYIALTLWGRQTSKRKYYLRGFAVSSLSFFLYILGVLLWRMDQAVLNNSISWLVLAIAILLILFEWGQVFSWLSKYALPKIFQWFAYRPIPKSPATIRKNQADRKLARELDLDGVSLDSDIENQNIGGETNPDEEAHNT